MEIPRYIGQNSIPAILRDQPSPIDTKNGIDIRRDMRPIWGLDNSAPFPLMSTQHLDKMTQEISAELPTDREVLKYVKLRSCTAQANSLDLGSSNPTKRSPIPSGGLSLI